MNNSTTLLMASLLGLLTANQALSQGFTSGSDGSYGPLTITNNTTLEMPADGKFQCTTITIAKDATLRFKRNPLNTPVFLLATEAVTIDGFVEVSGLDSVASIPDGGLGGPGGFDGGKPGFNEVPPGNGFGPGGGLGGVYDYRSATGAGSGSYGTVGTRGSSTKKGVIYGSPLLIPIIGGSGGGGTSGSPGRGGGGGGGAILIASSKLIQINATGKILALGGGMRRNNDGYPEYLHNAGSGGAIRLVAPKISGTGELNVNDGNVNYAGFGRIRIDSIDRTALQLNFVPSSVTSVGSTMLVFPTPLPQLDIVEAAGRTIALGSGPVMVQLPYNSLTNQVIKVQAKNFFSTVPIRVTLTPDNGTASTFDATIDNRSTNPAEASINVNMPVNVQVTIHAWTR